MIQMSSIATSLVEHERKSWALALDLFNTKDQKILSDSYPTHGFTRSIRDSGPKKHYAFSVQQLVVGNSFDDKAKDNIPEVWFKLANTLLSTDYQDAVSQRIGVDLKNAYINIGFYKFEKGDAVSPHIDNDDKILTQVFYFNQRWNSSWGGYFKMLGSNNDNDILFSVPPLSIFSAFIVRCESAWHMVSPIEPNAEECRLSMQLEFIRR